MRALASLCLFSLLLAASARGADDEAAWLAEAEAATGVTGASLVLPQLIGGSDFGSGGPGPQGMDVVVELGGVPTAIALSSRSIRSPGFQLLVASGEDVVAVPPPAAATYRGTVHVPGTDGSGTASASVGANGLTAFVVRPDGARFVLRPLADLVADAPTGLLLAHAAGAGPSNLGPLTSGYTAGSKVIELGIDCDVEYYQANGGSVLATLLDVETIVNEVSTIFDRDAGVVFEITTVVVRTTEPDPYTFTLAAALGNQFKSVWSNSLPTVHRDLAHLITGRDLDGNTRGSAFSSGVCSMSSGYGCSETTYTANLALRVATMSHYLGLNFGALLCDGAPDCQIMCSTIGGCNGVAGLGAASSAKIQSVAANAVCGSTHPGTLTLAFTDDFAPPTIDTNRWVVIDGAVIDASAPSPPSAGGALKLSSNGPGAFDGHELRSTTLDLTANSSATLRFSERRQGVENGEDLVVEISAGGALWGELLRLTSNGVDPGGWTARSVDLPGSALVDGLRVRFRTELDETNDTWWIDDVELIEIDTTPPTLGTLALTPDPWPPSSSLQVSIPVSDDLSGVGTVTASVKDGGSTVAQISLSHAGGGNYTGSISGGLAEKSYSVVIDAEDAQANASQTSAPIVVMDTPVASAPALDPDPALDSNPIVASVLITDSSAMASVTASGKVNGGTAVPLSLSFNSGSGRYEGTFPAFGTPGSLVVTFSATDIAAHTSAPVQKTLQLYSSSGAPPSVGTPSVTPNPVAAGGALSVSATVTDPDSPLVSVVARIVQSAQVKHTTPLSKGSGNTWSGSFASTPALVAGPFTVEVVANDLEGNQATKSKSATAFEAPTITSLQTAPASFDADDPFEVTAIVTHPIGVQSATASVSLNGGAFTNQAMAFHSPSGRYRASFPATGGGGTLTYRVAASSTDGNDADPVQTTTSVGYLPVTLTEVDPASGPLGGGTTVVVRGTGMAVDVAAGTARILFGGVDATSVQIVSDGELSGVLPAHGAGSVGVEVRVTKGGVVRSASLPGAFLYGVAPTLASLTPNRGSAFADTMVVLKGTGLSGSGGATVDIGGRQAVVDVVDDQTLLATVPPGEAPGTVETVTVTTSFGSVALASGFTQVGAALRRVDHVGLTGPPTATAQLRDLDLDGRPEVAVGVPTQGSGVVLVRRASDLAAITTLTSPSASPARFGEALATVSDADADGEVDLVVGEPGASSSRGAVHLIGSASGTPIWTHVGVVASSEVGASLARLGDLNGDGFDELAAGVPGRNEVRILDGQSGAALLVLPGPNAGASFGRSVHAVPFGPGRDDAAVIVGAPTYNPGGMANTGRAHVLTIDATTLALAGLATIDGDETGGAAGPFSSRMAVALAAGQNGDLVAAVGFPGANTAGSDAGLVRLVDGTTGGALGQHIGLQAGDALGASLAVLPDVDGDGLPEFLAGAPGTDLLTGSNGGAIVALSGADAAPLGNLVGSSTNERMGGAITLLHDHGDDLLPDLFAGSATSGANRWIRLSLHPASVAVAASAGHKLSAVLPDREDRDGMRFEMIAEESLTLSLVNKKKDVPVTLTVIGDGGALLLSTDPASSAFDGALVKAKGKKTTVTFAADGAGTFFVVLGRDGAPGNQKVTLSSKRKGKGKVTVAQNVEVTQSSPSIEIEFDGAAGGSIGGSVQVSPKSLPFEVTSLTTPSGDDFVITLPNGFKTSKKGNKVSLSGKVLKTTDTGAYTLVVDPDGVGTVKIKLSVSLPSGKGTLKDE